MHRLRGKPLVLCKDDAIAIQVLYTHPVHAIASSCCRDRVVDLVDTFVRLPIHPRDTENLRLGFLSRDDACIVSTEDYHAPPF